MSNCKLGWTLFLEELGIEEEFSLLGRIISKVELKNNICLNKFLSYYYSNYNKNKLLYIHST
jgi:hypothetical protein